MIWPKVLTEEETLDRVLAGQSLARFGDGEFNLVFGGKCKTQRYEAPIGATLRVILGKASGNCLVGIPRQYVGPKAEFWKIYDNSKFISLLQKPEYGSAFVTRPDSAPWIDTPSYWKKVKSIWQGKKITLVRGSEKSLTASMLKDAKSVREIICPLKDAYSQYYDIVQQVGDSPIVLLCLGATATIMAAELSLIGQQAIDLGHIGMFLGKHERNEPMVVTAEDKKVDEYA